jgi:hypothetical protein
MNQAQLLLRSSLALALVLAPVFPSAASAQTAPSAGQVAVVVPKVDLERGTRQLTASPHAPVYWGDLVNTLPMGRARIALNDGSVLNVGSQASLRIVKHDAGAQQTQMDLVYGRVRARAVHLTAPNASYEIHTRLGTAGVVGTDFFLALEGDMLRVIVFEGVVHFCNLAGVCVNVGPGEMSTVRDSQPPDPPAVAPTAVVVDAVNSTEVVLPGAGEKLPPPHHSPWLYVGLITIAAVPAIIVGVVEGTKGVRTPRPNGVCISSVCP